MNITLTVMSDDQSYVQYDCQRITVTNIQFPTLGAPRENAHGATLLYLCSGGAGAIVYYCSGQFQSGGTLSLEISLYFLLIWVSGEEQTVNGFHVHRKNDNKK